jgi:hypothetical protein
MKHGSLVGNIFEGGKLSIEKAEKLLQIYLKNHLDALY